MKTFTATLAGREPGDPERTVEVEVGSLYSHIWESLEQDPSPDAEVGDQVVYKGRTIERIYEDGSATRVSLYWCDQIAPEDDDFGWREVTLYRPGEWGLEWAGNVFGSRDGSWCLRGVDRPYTVASDPRIVA